jgi:hypothetical protein
MTARAGDAGDLQRTGEEAPGLGFALPSAQPGEHPELRARAPWIRLERFEVLGLSERAVSGQVQVVSVLDELRRHGSRRSTGTSLARPPPPGPGRGWTGNDRASRSAAKASASARGGDQDHRERQLEPRPAGRRLSRGNRRSTADGVTFVEPTIPSGMGTGRSRRVNGLGGRD